MPAWFDRGDVFTSFRLLGCSSAGIIESVRETTTCGGGGEHTFRVGEVDGDGGRGAVRSTLSRVLEALKPASKHQY